MKDVTASDATGNVDVVDNGDGTYTTEAITADTTIKVETDPVAVNLQVNFYNKEGELLPGSTINGEFTFDTDLDINLADVAKYEYKTGTELETGVAANPLTVNFTADYVSYDEATGEYYVEIRVDYTEIAVNVEKDADIAGDAEGKWKFTGSPATLDALSGDVTVTPTFDGWTADNSANARWFVIEVENAETSTFVYGLDNAGETTFEVSLTDISDEEVTITIKGIYGTEADANAAAEA